MLQVTYRKGAGITEVTSVDVYDNGHPMSDPEEGRFSVHDRHMKILNDYPLADVEEVIYKPETGR